jgi:hypothetical protein
MGVIFASDPCETCGYQPHSTLFYHGGKLGFFKGLATCNACRELVSIYPDEAHIPSGFTEMFGGVDAYQTHVASMRTRLNLEPPALNTCPLCHSHDLTHHDIWEVFVSKQPIRIACPRRETGYVVLTRSGMWD